MVIFKHTKKAEALSYMMWDNVLLSSHNWQEASKGKCRNIKLFEMILCCSLFSSFSCIVKTSNGLETFFRRKGLAEGN